MKFGSMLLSLSRCPRILDRLLTASLKIASPLSISLPSTTRRKHTLVLSQSQFQPQNVTCNIINASNHHDHHSLNRHIQLTPSVTRGGFSGVNTAKY